MKQFEKLATLPPDDAQALLPAVRILETFLHIIEFIIDMVLQHIPIPCPETIVCFNFNALDA